MAPEKRIKASSDEGVLSAIAEFGQMIGGLLPLAFKPPHEWEVVASAFIARFGDQLSSMALLIECGRYTDAALVLRSIYDSSVMFCWISADPETRFREWRQHSERGRSVAIWEAHEAFGVEAPEHEVDLRNEPHRLDNLANLARVADAHWSERLDAFRSNDKRGPEALLTLTGIYTAVYRAISRAAHGEAESVDSVIAPRANYVLITTETNVGRNHYALGLCIPLVGLAMVVYSHQFGGFDSRLIGEVSRGLGEPLAN